MTTQARLRKRNKEIARQLLGGKTCKELAHAFGMSKERIRQIVGEEGHSTAEIYKEKCQRQFNKELEACEKLAEKLGRLPTKSEMREQLRLYEPKSLVMQKALMEKGITKTIYEERHERKRREMLRYLKGFAKRLGYTPGNREISRDGKYHQSTFHYYFGKLTVAQQLAGLKPNQRGGDHKRT